MLLCTLTSANLMIVDSCCISSSLLNLKFYLTGYNSLHITYILSL